MKEPSLVFFTVLMQAAVGACATLGVLAWQATGQAGSPAAELLLEAGTIAILAPAILGLAASLFHLGNPWRAFRAVNNLRTSWLSREILLAALFASTSLALAVLQISRTGPLEMRIVVSWMVSLLGLALVYCMSRVYLLRTIPSWNHWETPISFFTTALLLGVLTISVVVSVKSSTATGQQALAWEKIVLLSSNWRASAALLLLSVQLLFAGARASRSGLQILHPETLAWRPRVLGKNALRVHLGLILSCITILVLTIIIGQGAADFWPGLHWLIWLAFCLAFCGEIAGRALFYARRG